MTKTTTKAATDWRSHQRPCFCDRCLLVTLDDLLDERARIYDGRIRDRAPEDLRGLADELIHGIPAARRQDVLEHMLTWDHLSPRVMAVDCLLDECDERSYQAVDAMARILLDAISDQDAAPRALLVIVENEIAERRRLGTFERALRQAS